METLGVLPDRRRSGNKEFLTVKKKAPERRTRRTHKPAFKARVVSATLREDKTMVELCEHYELHPNHKSEWKRHLEHRCVRFLDGEEFLRSARIGLAPVEPEWLFVEARSTLKVGA